MITWDTETALFRPGRMAPPLTCVSYVQDDSPPGLVDHVEGPALVRASLEKHEEQTGHNMPYDLLVVCQADDMLDLVFRAYRTGQIHDTKIRQQVADIARGEFRWTRTAPPKRQNYGLDDLCYRHLGYRLDKDTWRLRYGELRGVPIDQWEEGAREYPKADAVTTRLVWQAQVPECEGVHGIEENTYAAWWLHLMAAWGVRTSRAGVQSLIQATTGEIAAVRDRLVSLGLVRPKKVKGVIGWSRDTKLAKVRMVEAMAEQNRPVKCTPTGEACLDADACTESGDPALVDYAKYTELSAVIAKDLPKLAEGVDLPIHASYGMAASGRTTCSGPNMQNWRRLAGVRECFVPREGCHFIQADYTGFELVALAQTCLDLFGHSELAQVLRSGEDAHLSLAAVILDKPYEWCKANKKTPEVDDARQLAKAANFGLPGGLGVPKFCMWAKAAYGIQVSLETGHALKASWKARFPEVQELFDYVNARVSEGLPIVLPRQGLICGGVSFTEGCNRLFQGPAARAAKRAGCLIAEACYLDEASPLYDSRMVVFAHDEFIGEAAIDVAPEAAEELSRVMCAGAAEYFPDVPVKAEPCVMRVWSKDAKTLRDDNGRLVAWPLDETEGKE